MNFEIQTSSYFDAEAKRLAKRHRSFVDDLQDFRDNLLKNPYQGTELSPGIRKVRLTIGSKGRGKSGGAAREVPLLLGPRFFSDLDTVTLSNVNQSVQGKVLQLKLADAGFQQQYLSRFLIFLLTCYIFYRLSYPEKR